MVIENLSDISATNSTVVSVTKSFLFEGFLTKAVWALLILLGGMLIGKILGRITQRILEELELNKALSKFMPGQVSYDELVGSILTKIIYVVFVILALNQLRLTALVLDTVSIIVIVIVVVLVLLGVKDFMKNIIAGVVLQIRQLARPDDVIYVDSVSGKVVKFDLLETTVKTYTGDLIHIPNSYLFSRKVKVVARQRSG